MATKNSIHERQRQLMFTMGQVNKQWRRTLDKTLAPLGLTQAMWLPLLHLEHADGAMRQKDLAQSLALDSSSVVRLIDGLEAQGWVQRLDDSDRRVKRIQLTPEGHAQVEAVKKVVTQMRSEVMQDFPMELLESVMQGMQGMLDKMILLEARASAEPSNA